MDVERRRAFLLLASLATTFATLRLYLHRWPDTNLDVGPYNVHHLFTGVLLMTLAGVPLAVGRGDGRGRDAAVVLFGVGLSMALDEWVFLVATDGSDASYLLPVSLGGGAILVGLAALYAAALLRFRGKTKG